MGAPHRLAVGGSLEAPVLACAARTRCSASKLASRSQVMTTQSLKPENAAGWESSWALPRLVEAEPPCPEAGFSRSACNRVVSSLGGRWDLAALSRLLTKAAVAERLERAGSKRLPLLHKHHEVNFRFLQQRLWSPTLWST